MSDSLSRALAHLPHGPEFRFLDRVVALEPGRSGAGEYLVRGDEPFLRGHFAGDPIFPGVLLLEAGAQLAGVVAQSDPAGAPLSGLRLTAIRGVKIFGTARPGETLRIEARLAARMGNLVQARIVIAITGRVVLEGEVTLAGT